MKRKKILVIDDDATLTEMFKRHFSEYVEYELRVENSPSKALATLRDFVPDIILLDVMMPEHDGGDVAASIRRQPAMGRVPIVFMTGAVRKKEVDEGKGYIGGEPFIAKPFDFPYLISRIRQHLP